MAKLIGKTRIGSQLVMVEKETSNNDAELGEQPVEEGLPLTDHSREKPISLSINGKIIRETDAQAKSVTDAINNYKKKKQKISYEGRRIYHNMMIETFQLSTDKSTANGYSFTMTLREIRIAKPSYVSTGKSNAGRKQTQNGKGSGAKEYHKVKKGDTYWALGIKYGTPWPQLEKWNGYPPRRIPIGVRLRVA
jgi:LysM repeat protein